MGDGTDTQASLLQEVKALRERLAQLEKAETERERIAKELRSSEATLRSVLRAAPVGIGLVSDRVLGWTNDRIHQMTGYTGEELTGQNIRMLYESEAEFERIGRTKYDQLNQQGESTVEARWRRKDGTVIDVLLSSSLVALDTPTTDVTFTALDITARKRAEELIRKSELQLRNIIEHSTNVFYTHNTEHVVTYMSPQIKSLLDCEPEEVLCRWTDFVTDNPINEKGYEYTQKAIDTGKRQPPYELELLSKKGRKVRVEVHEAPVIQDGVTIAITGALTDITERRRAEQEREQLASQLRQAQKMEAVGQLAGGVAHDFNNLLTAILGNADLALMSLEGDGGNTGAIACSRALEHIKSASERGAILTRQLLTFSRKQVPKPEELDVNEIVTGMDSIMRRLLGEQIEIKIVLAPDPLRILADASHIEQVILNLALNARDAMPKGGTLTIELAAVDLDKEHVRKHIDAKTGPHAMISVTDTGEGMSREVLSHLFEPFFTTKPVGKGAGLGLATAYGIMKQTGGHITVDSAPGKGSTFRLYLPALIKDPTTPPKQDDTPRAGGNETVLLCEDEEMVRKLARTILSNAGYTVLEARDGQQALTVAAEHSGTIDLLITDMVMPHMNGWELAKTLKKKIPDLTLLFVSGYAADVIDIEGLLDQELPFLQKPFQPADLLREIRKVLDARPSLR